MLKEFKEFAMKGNVVDLAVAIILGTAFTAIVRSLVDDIVMPPIGVILGGVDFSSLYINLSGGEYASLAEAREAGAATINYGVFINAVITFVIVAWIMFMIVRTMNRMAKKEEDKPGTPATPPRQEQLLEEIRDLLKKE
ncbi:MAG: large conductance mechanosensitive channel protein MscL [Azospirillaceae bacterium]